MVRQSTDSAAKKSKNSTKEPKKSASKSSGCSEGRRCSGCSDREGARTLQPDGLHCRRSRRRNVHRPRHHRRLLFEVFVVLLVRLGHSMRAGVQEAHRVHQDEERRMRGPCRSLQEVHREEVIYRGPGAFMCTFIK
ncbi:hypothetical protein L596_013922 [Steinernema carpocapsae]|uniref:Uncharacterized protein n=1 Tax=Steinernema carpocapsae TaxID=34508 RepID=A0A4U5P1S2_STECR|nr:hypothetical protein L596_013922 [Steinernema carpocapsae]